MEPDEIAQNVFDRVRNYCENNSGDTPLECMVYHSPDQLSEFIDAYLTDEEDEAIQNSDQNFWESLKKEYEKLRKEWFSEELAYDLGHLIVESKANRIMQYDDLDSATKVRYLKAYEEVLHKFANAIKYALQNGEPLSSAELYKWFKRLAEATSSFNSDYRKEVKYVLDYYDMWDVDQQQVLSLLLDYIDRTIYNIENKYLPELEALTNNNS